jgi:hypothetical protein
MAFNNSKNQHKKPQMHNERNKNKITTTDQPITTANRFTLLHNLEEDTTTKSNGHQNHKEQDQMHKFQFG